MSGSRFRLQFEMGCKLCILSGGILLSVVVFLLASTPPISSYCMGFVISNDSWTTAFLDVPALKFFILAHMLFLFVVERSAVRYDRLDPRMIHGGCRVIARLSSGV